MTGAQYLAGYRIVPLVSVATVLSGLAFWYRTAFMFKKRNQLGLIAVAAGAAINIGLNLLLIPRYGYVAAGFTTLIGYVALNVLSYLLSRRIFYWRLPVKSMTKALLASTLMGLVVWAFESYSPLSTSLTLVIGVLLGIVVVVVALVAMREFSHAELVKFRQFFSSGSPVDTYEDE
jgi:O-antigen/teichoic acid export membrane protein